jgi:histidine ammonia-lyase
MTAPALEPVSIGAAPLSVEELVRVARGARVTLEPAAVERIRAGRAIVDAAIAGPDLVYGLNTGLGHMRDERIEVDVLRRYQEAIVASHAGGIGPPLPTDVVRAAMAVRLAGIARGGSGATLAAAEALAALLNAGVHPVVPTIGSVGASDLMHMAEIALVLLGSGRAEYGGIVLPGDEALRQAGLGPLRMEPKDGLALISANGVAIGRAALTVTRAAEVAAAADVVGALSLEAVGGNPSIVEPAVAVAKPVDGQIAAAARIRAFLAGSERCRPSGPRSVQDPLSFRVIPQVHGALREFVAIGARAVATELAAMDDNPLVAIDEGRLISNGNFHPIVLALAMDALRPAIAHVGLLADRRLGHLWSAMWSDPDLLTPDGLERLTHEGGRPLLRYAAATRTAALRGLAGPATLDVPTLDLGVEDHATNAPETVARTDEALDALEDILAIELILASGVIRRGGLESSLGVGTGAAFGVVEGIVGAGRGTPSGEVVALVCDALGGAILDAAEAAAGVVR